LSNHYNHKMNPNESPERIRCPLMTPNQKVLHWLSKQKPNYLATQLEIERRDNIYLTHQLTVERVRLNNLRRLFRERFNPRADSPERKTTNILQWNPTDLVKQLELERIENAKLQLQLSIEMHRLCDIRRRFQEQYGKNVDKK